MKMPLNEENLAQVIIICFHSTNNSIGLYTGYGQSHQIDLGGEMDKLKEFYLLDIGPKAYPLIISMMEAITHKRFIADERDEDWPYYRYKREDAPEEPIQVLKMW